MLTEVSKLLELVRETRGKRCVEVLVGPAGFHIHAGSIPKILSPSVVEIAFWMKCPILINNKSVHFLECDAFPKKSVERTLRTYLEGKMLTDADVDIKNNSLRLVIDEEYLFSAFPSEQTRGLSYLVFDQRKTTKVPFVVFKDNVCMGQ